MYITSLEIFERHRVEDTLAKHALVQVVYNKLAAIQNISVERPSEIASICPIMHLERLDELLILKVHFKAESLLVVLNS